MRRNTLTSAVLAGVAGVAGLSSVSNAVNLNSDGLGEVLIYPYYTVNGGNFTLISVVNTTEDVKAVKVRFMDSKNSREVLDFNLYLSPLDVWTGAIFDPGNDGVGVAAVQSADNSCTVPAFAQTGLTTDDGIPYVEFKTLLFNELSLFTTNSLDRSDERTREGHLEMIEMGIFHETVEGTSSTQTGLEWAAIHDSGGVPNDCAYLVNAWVPGGIWNATGVRGPDTDVRTPEGGLFGGASIISIAKGQQVSYNATAIDAFFEDFGADNGPLAGPATLHFQPGSSKPSLNQGDSDTTSGVNVSNVFDNGAVVTSYWAVSGSSGNRAYQPIDAVTALFMHNEIYNEYSTISDIAGVTEWVITHPTKTFYVNRAAGSNIHAWLPYVAQYNDAIVGTGGACDPIGISYTDREEGNPGVAPGQVNFSPFDPDSPVIPVLCYEAQVVSFNQSEQLEANGVSWFLGSPNARNVDTNTVGGDTYDSGWATIDFTGGLGTSGPGNPAVGTEDHTLISSTTDDAGGTVTARIYVGLAVRGFGIQTVTNGQLAGGTLANYAGLFDHRADRLID